MGGGGATKKGKKSRMNNDLNKGRDPEILTDEKGNKYIISKSGEKV